MIEIGDKISFIPDAFSRGDPAHPNPYAAHTVSGRVVYINREHGWYRVKYTYHDGRYKDHECFRLEPA